MLNNIFGKKAGISSPQELERQRELARTIKARSTGRVPQDPWDGLNAIASAIGGRIEDSRLDETETEARKRADDRFNSLFNGSESAHELGQTRTFPPAPYSPPRQVGLPDIAKALLSRIAGLRTEQNGEHTRFGQIARLFSGARTTPNSAAQSVHIDHKPRDLRPDSDLVAIYSDPWTSQNQRELLKLYIQRQIAAGDVKTTPEPEKVGTDEDSQELAKPK